MAILSTVHLPSGITVTNAYTRIASVAYTKDELIVSTTTHVDYAAREAGLPTLLSQAYSLPWSADVSLTYCYDQLKALSDFGGAVDA